MVRNFRKEIIFVSVLIILIFPLFAFADSEGQVKNFFVDSAYDSEGREQVPAFLEEISQNGYFYLENEWYQNLSQGEREVITQNLTILTQEFDQTIYPELTSAYGSEWKPGIDSDYRMTILFHQMKEGIAGYFKEGDEYPKLQDQTSNEREMIYLSAEYLKSPLIKSYLAHEFTHLITFNQKERLRGVSEEIWLNETRAEYAPTLLGYDDEYQGSNLQQRVKQFITSPSDSLTEWQNQKSDYSSINIFTQYLMDHYGIEILADSLQSSQIGIPSLNYALEKNNIEKDFSQIFTDWTIAIFLNDCQVEENYCYKNENLKNLKVSPSLIFLPSTQKTSVSLNYSVKQWSGNWYRIMGGEGDLKLEFDGEDQVEFRFPYVLCKDSQTCQVDFLDLDEKQTGQISFENFGEDYISLTLILSIQSKISGFNGRESSFSFSLSVSMEMKTEKEELIAQLKAQISELLTQIAELQVKIAAIFKEKISCDSLESNLYYGLESPEVSCLQEFLKAQGAEIYPEGLVTGFFGPLTQAAVSRFQEKYAAEILTPLDLGHGTGFAGISTRSKINQILK